MKRHYDSGIGVGAELDMNDILPTNTEEEKTAIECSYMEFRLLFYCGGYHRGEGTVTLPPAIVRIL